ncbi:MAG: phosphate acetyltransferase [Desulfovibrio sp.]|jgi:phosphate acetyltransferase|nr:phosphate acetyltransferase [Desulfovibrio sp.]
MAKNLYVMTTEIKSGKSSVILGMMQLLLRHLRNVAFFRPVISTPQSSEYDHSINLILKHFTPTMPYEDAYACTLQDARNQINTDRRELMLENIVSKYKHVESKYDFVLCEGTDFTSKDPAFEFDLNCAVAANIGSPILLVISALEKSFEEVKDSAQLTLDQLNEKGLDVIACIVNRSRLTKQEEDDLTACLKSRKIGATPLLVSVLPEDFTLAKPTVLEVQQHLKADVLYGHERIDSLVDGYLIAAMQMGNFFEYLAPGCMILTPGDRVDILLGSLAARFSSSCPDISGIILTGGFSLPASVRRLIDGWSGAPLPVLSVPYHTYETIERLSLLQGKIEPGDEVKINTALGHFEACVDTRELSSRLVNLRSAKITPKMFEYNLIERAASQKMRIVLPEGGEERILKAANILVRRNVADIILLGRISEIQTKMSELGLDVNIPVIQPDQAPMLEDYAHTYYELRKAKGISIERARDTMLDPSFFGTMMVYRGDADGMVSGSVNTTAHTIRPAFEFIKTRPGASIVSSIFLMCLKDRVLAFGDCAVNPNPTAAELADIAINAAETSRIFGIDPKVAMLSYSTGSSGKGGDVDLVVEATRIAKERDPALLLEGPLQYDAAIDPEVARIKLPNSRVAGHATVFIFPDLNTGNNTYKAVQRAAGAVAIGPVLQGLNKPVNDLSRGCTVPDIVNTVAITAVQAQSIKKTQRPSA